MPEKSRPGYRCDRRPIGVSMCGSAGDPVPAACGSERARRAARREQVDVMMTSTVGDALNGRRAASVRSAIRPAVAHGTAQPRAAKRIHHANAAPPTSSSAVTGSRYQALAASTSGRNIARCRPRPLLPAPALVPSAGSAVAKMNSRSTRIPSGANSASNGGDRRRRSAADDVIRVRCGAHRQRAARVRIRSRATGGAQATAAQQLITAFAFLVLGGTVAAGGNLRTMCPAGDRSAGTDLHSADPARRGRFRWRCRAAVYARRRRACSVYVAVTGVG